ncbi:anti-sigma factor [Candidatus Gracilibacteria bacterium]|nr:anti-sigma factor [Candidatus Gracilibacteria bacterium]NJM90362.1 anti-sigma factor [Hydrococcus sp. RU_2_2]NJQ97638.1 anti-sigma factor [Hydrococcus sp. CSU_1_8]
MESNFNERNCENQSESEQSEMNPQYTRFELLSAYLDGEVTPAERRQVQDWLDTDPQTQKLYTRLLRLRQELDNIPIAPVASPSTQLSDQVFARLDRHSRRKRIAIIGGAAIATVVIGALSSLFFGNKSPLFQAAENPLAPIEKDSEPLKIALNHPIIEIPAAAILPIPDSNRTNSK